MKKLAAGLVSMFCSAICVAQADTIQARLVLIGDAGKLFNGKQPVIESVRKNINLDKKTTVLYLGDNLYLDGLPDEQDLTYTELRAVLDTQVQVNRGTAARVYMIPGNHDWNNSSRYGLQFVQRQQELIDNLGAKQRVSFEPKDGCPGPVEVSLSDEVVLIMLDTQWWLHRWEKPGIESDCPYKTQTEVLSQLEDLIAKHSKKLVILATHHPFKSYGIHGGYFPLKSHIFPLTDIRKNLYVPLPGIGSIYPIARGVFGTPQDLKHPTYVNMVNAISKVAQQHPNIIFVAGHEHNQQLIKDSTYYYIVSGAGCKETRVSPGSNSLYVSDTLGYAVLEISKNKNVRTSFYNVTGEDTRLAYDSNLFNFSKLPPLRFEDTVRIVYVPFNADSITISANPRYNNASGLKRFFNGDNYREEWATPVRLPVFKIRKLGLKPVSIGGGKQTKSLRLADKNGKEYVLRTIDKDLEKLLPANFRATAAQNYLQDFVTTAHPYSPVIVPPLAKAANVVVASPKIYFVPNDNDFGEYRQVFANKICLFEEREPVASLVDTRSTAKVISKMREDNDHTVDQQAVLRARLLDILIADWDRHFDQWRFIVGDTGKGKLYIPIPRDRDQAFSVSDGLLIKAVSANRMPFLQGFRKDIRNVKWLSYWARDFDRLFLNNLERNDWQKAISNFQSQLSDQVIRDAVQKMPKEVYALKGSLIEEKIRSRRDQLMKAGLQYYNFLAKEVNIVGSNEHEYFKVSKVGDQVQVRVYSKNQQDTTSVLYDRKFHDAITKEIRLYGLNGDDYYDIDADATSNIKIRIIGGRGNDTFDVKGNVRALIYDLETEKNFIKNGAKVRERFSAEPAIHDYSPTGYEYNRINLPELNLGYNVEDGPLVGIGFSKTTHSFRKEPFATHQRLTSLFAVNRGSYQVRYNGQFNRVLGKNDLLLNGQIVKPVLNNFFGLGNNSENDIQLGRRFYRVRYNFVEAEALLGRRPNSVLTYGVGPYFYHYWNRPQDNENRILSHPGMIGLDSVNVYSNKSYFGGRFMALVNNLNNQLYPTRGVYWLTQFTSVGGLNKASAPVTSFTTDMTVYSSLAEPAKLMSVLRIGGGHIFTRNFEYFQAMNLGQNNFLRGFRKNRFAGSGAFYTSLELRYRLFQSTSYIFPGAVGVVAFNDLGRVWMRGEDSKRWHNSYGGGFYYAAYNAVLISATIGFSQEEKLFNFSLGTKFNLTF
ncbi:BamA/TamA family outer membrane protein [Aridibaculum aurantiacum]|uniref:BamA/TamA family outer membrane protein n=1 Tax=Aridibaculum aurantiacum TaxID=2810307 RepID=UPI001A956959|nr:BamA/TamA family outer membrane protein [Aridibaculum aurantiacum]